MDLLKTVWKSRWRKNLIEKKNKELAMNIDDYKIGEFVVDFEGKKKAEYEILEKTRNTLLLSMKKTNKKGVDCKQWFSISDFNKIGKRKPKFKKK